MKYIRTKDGHIYKIWKDTGVDGFIAEGEITTRNGEHIGSFKGFVPVGYDKVIAQADTIEELCDEIIVIDSHDNSHYELHRCFGEFCLDGWLKQNEKEKDRYKFYGAIWTDKGLIYVAKMNEKGELELL